MDTIHSVDRFNGSQRLSCTIVEIAREIGGQLISVVRFHIQSPNLVTNKDKAADRTLETMSSLIHDPNKPLIQI